jgi:Ca2+-binding RTX toxin-like protein
MVRWAASVLVVNPVPDRKALQASTLPDAAAGDRSDAITYNTTTDALYYDPDGTGAKAAVQFATLTGLPALGAEDFWII